MDFEKKLLNLIWILKNQQIHLEKKTLPEYLFDNFFYQFVNNFLELL